MKAVLFVLGAMVLGAPQVFGYVPVNAKSGSTGVIRPLDPKNHHVKLPKTLYWSLLSSPLPKKLVGQINDFKMKPNSEFYRLFKYGAAVSDTASADFVVLIESIDLIETIPAGGRVECETSVTLQVVESLTGEVVGRYQGGVPRLLDSTATECKEEHFADADLALEAAARKVHVVGG